MQWLDTVSLNPLTSWKPVWQVSYRGVSQQTDTMYQRHRKNMVSSVNILSCRKLERHITHRCSLMDLSKPTYLELGCSGQGFRWNEKQIAIEFMQPCTVPKLHWFLSSSFYLQLIWSTSNWLSIPSWIKLKSSLHFTKSPRKNIELFLDQLVSSKYVYTTATFIERSGKFIHVFKLSISVSLQYYFIKISVLYNLCEVYHLKAKPLATQSFESCSHIADILGRCENTHPAAWCTGDCTGCVKSVVFEMFYVRLQYFIIKILADVLLFHFHQTWKVFILACNFFYHIGIKTWIKTDYSLHFFLWSSWF